jgi:hypothetical protein
MARAEDLFSMIVERGEDALDELIEQCASEELFLDFKRSGNNGAGNSLNIHDRNNLEKVISGFGNSEGGVVVWGIECSSNPETGDVASEKVSIENPARFKSLVENAISGRTIPAHSKIQNHVITCDDGRGFVITLIPQSDHAPHQTTRDNKYYMRAGSSFLPVPHAILAGMFGRRPQPHVFHTYTLPWPEPIPGGDGINFSIGLLLRNEGPGIASDIFATVIYHTSPGENCSGQFTQIEGELFIGNIMLSSQLSVVSRPEFKLPPDADCSPFSIQLRLLPPFTTELKITGNCGCSGGQTHKFEIIIPPDRIEAAVQNIWRSINRGEGRESYRQYTDELFRGEN